MREILGTALLLLSASLAFGQAADIPPVDSEGNFQTSRIRGNRGFYQQKSWLVVDRDPSGANCRSLEQHSKVVLTLRVGTVIESLVVDGSADAIEFIDGQPWLKAAVRSNAVLRRFEDYQEIYYCRVRAHAEYIFPINNDDAG